MECGFSKVIDILWFYEKGPHHWYFPENFQKFSKQLFLYNTSGRLFLNLQTILVVSTPSYLPHLYVETGRGEENDVSQNERISIFFITLFRLNVTLFSEIPYQTSHLKLLWTGCTERCSKRSGRYLGPLQHWRDQSHIDFSHI